MKSAKRKTIAQNLKFKYIVLSIDFHLSYLIYKIEARRQNPVFRMNY